MQDKVSSTGASGAPSLTGVPVVNSASTSLTPKMAVAAKLQKSMPNTNLASRATIIMEKSKSMGVGGFFRALWNYISNSSTKSMDQAKLNVVATDYLKDNLKEIDGIIDDIIRETTMDTSSRDQYIFHAFAAALKEIDPDKFEDFSTTAKGLVDGVLAKGAQMSSDITPDNIKHAANLVGKLKSAIEFSQSTIALYLLAQRFPADQITSELIAFCKDFPEQARTLAKRQDFQLTSFRGTNCDDGMMMMYKDSGYKPEILDLINTGLFEGENRDARIASFLKDPAMEHNHFWIDGLQRGDVPHISLPNGVEILSNFGGANSEYCKSTGEQYDRAAYLKHMLDKFGEAYGNTDEAIKAFKVLVQNFTGSGNTYGRIFVRLASNEAVLPGFEPTIRMACAGKTLMYNRSRSMMRMDKNFNINLSIIACISGEGIQQFNEIYKDMSESSSFSEDRIFGITINAHIPAVINDTMDQREQNGKQTTTFGIIESFGN